MSNAKQAWKLSYRCRRGIETGKHDLTDTVLISDDVRAACEVNFPDGSVGCDWSLMQEVTQAAEFVVQSTRFERHLLKVFG